MKPYLKKLSLEEDKLINIIHPRVRIFHKEFLKKIENVFTDNIPPDIKNILNELLKNLAGERKRSDRYDNNYDIFKPYYLEKVEGEHVNPLLSSIIKSISRGTVFYISELDYIPIQKLLYLNNISPMKIPITSSYKIDINFLQRNIVEYSALYFSIPNLLSGFFEEKLVDMVNMINKFRGAVIVDIRNIFNIFEINNTSKVKYNPKKPLEKINYLTKRIHPYSEDTCLIVKIPIGFYTPNIPDINFIAGRGEWINHIRKIYYIENTINNYFTDISEKIINEFNNILKLIHFINYRFLEYIKIVFEELEDYIIMPHNNMLGGFNILINLVNKETIEDVANEIFTKTELITYPLQTTNTSNTLVLHILPSTPTSLEEYQEKIKKLKKIVSREK